MIFFSLYRGVPDHRFQVFQQTRWKLDNGVALEAHIIGKSHRIVSRLGKECFTEFIACFEPPPAPEVLDRVCLRSGVVHHAEHRSGNWVYQVEVEHAPGVYAAMDEFLNSLPGVAPTGVLQHTFENAGEVTAARPFTGLAVDSAANAFYTVHTYPETDFSIVSRTAITCPVVSGVS
ncbi:MAG: DUF2617 family protein [Nitrospinaceae bacterium]